MFKKRGFTLVEVLLVVVIVGILAAIVIPRIIYTQKDAQVAACKANIAALNSQIEYYHYNTSAWPTDLSNLTPDFIDAVPVCPFATAYVFNATTNRVNAHTH